MSFPRWPGIAWQQVLQMPSMWSPRWACPSRPTTTCWTSSGCRQHHSPSALPVSGSETTEMCGRSGSHPRSQRNPSCTLLDCFPCQEAFGHNLASLKVGSTEGGHRITVKVQFRLVTEPKASRDRKGARSKDWRKKSETRMTASIQKQNPNTWKVKKNTVY